VFSHFNRIHVTPPLVTSEADLAEGVAILDAAIAKADAHL
jgi:taurine--2-oxoglutarate transaminase